MGVIDLSASGTSSCDDQGVTCTYETNSAHSAAPGTEGIAMKEGDGIVALEPLEDRGASNRFFLPRWRTSCTVFGCTQ